MRSFVFTLLVLISLSFSSFAQEKPAIIPKPMSLEWKKGEFRFPREITIHAEKDAQASLSALKDVISTTGNPIKVISGEGAVVSLTIDQNLASKLSKEGYELLISPEQIQIKAADNAGLFYGISTLRQLFPTELEKGVNAQEFSIPAVSIVDKPYYQWRGSMIDMARSFFGMEYLKKHIDRMALYKLNRFHLHLSDDQGWRIEIKKWPKLAEIGGKSAVNNGRPGYLTQEQFLELQAYAKARHIVIIPEIDMPGHTYAALQGYPELSCENFDNLEPKRATPPEPYPGVEVGWSKFCMEKPVVYRFIREVIEELANITEGPYIHIGGDEIEDEHYKEFVIKAEKIVRENGKTAVGWEEVTKAKVDSSFISQRWTGKTESIVETRIIQSICSSFYLDHGNIPDQPDTYSWCKKDGVSLKNVYDFVSENSKTIGVEGAMWSELVHNDRAADDRLWPRSIAVAEIGWTAPGDRDYGNFVKRLGNHGKRMEYLSIDFFKSPGVNWRLSGKTAEESEPLP